MRTAMIPVFGQRSTRQKRALAALLANTAAFRSARELHADLVAREESVGLTTVYSQLRALAESGVVDVVHNQEGEALYRQCSTAVHHDHLRCGGCGYVVEIDNAEIELWIRDLSRRTRFGRIRYTLDLTGLCEPCRVPAPTAL